jgi:Apea-like HEPN
LLSLLTHTQGSSYFGKRHLLIDTDLVNPMEPRKPIWRDAVFWFMLSAIRYPNLEDSELWTFYPSALSKIKEVASLLERAFINGLQERLLYIGGILKTASHIELDERTCLLLLTSIIELLVTHNPDFNRFNVEDSINKQFQLKASLLIYLNDKSRDITEIKKRLKIIYTQRSNIAHGNFEAVDKYISGLSKKEDQEEYFEDLIIYLYSCIRAIMEEYLKDKSLVEFLKEN